MALKADSAAGALLTNMLNEWGLGELADWVYSQLVDGNSEAEVLFSLREQPVYKERFKANDLRKAQGLQPMSEAQILQYEQDAAALMRLYGMPESFYDQPSDFAELAGNNLSIRELEERVQIANDIARNTDDETLAALELHGITPDNAAAVLLDPDRGEQALKAQFKRARVQGAAARQSQTASDAEAARLARGVSVEQAEAGFSTLTRFQEVVDGPTGQNLGALSREDQLRAIEGETEAVRKLEDRARAQTAQFAGGGSFASDRQGFSGLK